METALHYNRYRYYEPKLGRYLTVDPIGLAGGLNTYDYAAGNPLTYVDALGLNPAAGCVVGAWGGPIGCGVGAVVGTVAAAVAVGAIVSTPGDTPVEQETLFDNAGRKVSPVAAGMRPPGNCSPEEQNRLQDEVESACKGEPRSCSKVTDTVVASLYRARNLRCGYAREEINNQCYADGDLGHRNESIKAWEVAARCESIIR